MKKGVHLVIVHAADLSLDGMRRKVGTLLPLRDLAGHGALIDYLQTRSRAYRRAAERGR